MISMRCGTKRADWRQRAEGSLRSPSSVRYALGPSVEVSAVFSQRAASPHFVPRFAGEPRDAVGRATRRKERATRRKE